MKNHNKTDEQIIIESANRTLDKSCDKLDGQTLSRLHKIRYDAINQSMHNDHYSYKRFFGPIAAVATSCFVAVMFISLGSPSIQTIEDSQVIEDIEILSAAEYLEFYEDFEFYQWLDENEPSV